MKRTRHRAEEMGKDDFFIATVVTFILGSMVLSLQPWLVEVVRWIFT